MHHFCSVLDTRISIWNAGGDPGICSTSICKGLSQKKKITNTIQAQLNGTCARDDHLPLHSKIWVRFSAILILSISILSNAGLTIDGSLLWVVWEKTLFRHYKKEPFMQIYSK